MNMLTDAVLLLAAYFAAVNLRFEVLDGIAGLPLTSGLILRIVFVYILAIIFAYYLFSIYNHSNFRRRSRSLILLSINTVGTVTLAAVLFALRLMDFSRWTLVFFWLFSNLLIIGKHKIPNRYNTTEFTSLMTWSALKGGLSLALALSTAEFLPQSSYNVVIIVTSVTMYFTIVVQGLTTKKVFALIEKHKADRIRV